MTNREIIKRLNDLFEEAIANYPEEDLIKEIKENPDPLFDRNLKYIRKRNTIAKANLQKVWWNSAKEEIERLIEKLGKSGLIETLLKQPQYKELAGFFSKYEEISDEDKESMMTDKKMLELISKLKEETKNEKDSNE